MTIHTTLSREQLIDKIEKLTLACTVLRYAFEKILASVYEGHPVGEHDIDQYVSVLITAEANAPLREAEAMAATAATKITTELASIIGDRPKTRELLAGMLH